MIKYRSIREEMFSDEIGSYISYGIELTDGDNVVRKISDVSTDEETVSHLVLLSNELNLSPIHIDDVISDIL